MITAETCEAHYKDLLQQNPEAHPADLIVQVLHDFLRERGMGKKGGSTALERMVGFMEQMDAVNKELAGMAIKQNLARILEKSATKLTNDNLLTPKEIVDLLEPAIMNCEFHSDSNPSGDTDWKSWLIEQIEKYAQSKL